MKKLIVLMLLFASLIADAQSNSKGVVFESLTFQEAVEKSKVTGMPLFIHCYASWCHICDYMRDSIYTDERAGVYFRKNFVCVKYDMEKEGLPLASRFQVSKFPTYLFFNGSEELLHRAAGKKSLDDLITIAEDAKIPEKRFSTLQKKFNAGQLTVTELPFFFKMVAGAGLDNQPLISNYLMKVADSSFCSRDNWRIINDFFRDVEQPANARILQFRKELAKLYTADSIENRFIINYNGTLMNYVQKVDSAGYFNLVDQLQHSGLEYASKIISYAELNRAKLRSEYDNYQRMAPLYINKYGHGDQRRLSDIALNIYETGKGDSIMRLALTWAQEAVRLFDGYRNNHTLAALYYKLGNKAEAEKAAMHAIEIARKNNTDYKLTTQLFSKIEELP